MNKLIIKLIALVALLATFGCEMFDPGSLIVSTRVLGARVEVQGDPARSSPQPGETAHVTWIVASPEDAPLLRWAFVACAVTDAKACSGSPLAPFTGEGSVPELELEVPSAEELGEARRILLLGVICEVGTPALNERGHAVCAGDGAHGTPVTLDLFVARDRDEVNHQPSLDGARVTLDGEVWAPDTAAVARGACGRGDGLPIVEAGSELREIVLTLEPAVREQVADAVRGQEALETLQISHFVTAGELDGQYSYVERSDQRQRPNVTFTWDPPAKDDVPAQGEVVRLVLVVRDLRGGTSTTSRALCVVR